MDRVKKSKSFRCFRPVVLNDDDGFISGDRVFKRLQSAGDNHGTKSMAIPKINDDDGRCRNHKSHSSFSRVLKAVLLETSLAKKIRKRRSSRKNSRGTDFAPKINKIARDQPSESQDSFNNFSSSSSCSCVSSISSNPRSSPERKRLTRGNSIESKQVNGKTSYCPFSVSKSKKNVRSYGSETGLCLLLICLLVLVFWGKACAIFCTSTWLYLAPGRSYRVDRPDREVDLPDVDSKWYKKRVVMEGLLERNRL